MDILLGTQDLVFFALIFHPDGQNVYVSYNPQDGELLIDKIHNMVPSCENQLVAHVSNFIKQFFVVLEHIGTLD